MREHDIILGRLGSRFIKLHGGSGHVAVLAPTRSGKSSSFAIPAALTWGGSLICLDVKGELFAATAGHREAMGQQVFRFEPMADSGRSHRWDPFASVDRRSVYRFRDLQRIAFMLFPEPLTGRGNDRHWEDVGRRAFFSVAMLLAESPGETLSMAAILRLFSRSDGLEWLAGKLKEGRRTGRPYSQEVADGISSLMSGDERRIGETLSTVSARLGMWTQPATVAATSAGDFDLRDMRRKPMTVYVVVSPADIAQAAPLLRLLFDQAIALNSISTPEQDPTLQWQTLLLLDEFARLGRIPSVGHFLQFAGGYGCRVAIIAQDAGQVRELYGQNGAQDIFDNATTHIFLSGISDVTTAREIERRLGDDTVPVVSRNRPRFMSWLRPGRQGLSQHPHRQPLLLAQEILGMGSEEELILRPGMPAVRAKKIRWWQEPCFTRLVRPPPEIPELKIEVPLDDGQPTEPRRRRSGMMVDPEPAGNIPLRIRQ